MSLLALKHISKRYGRGSHARVALHDVSLEIETGELVAVWGRRRSGRSTLLHVAAGLETPDTGVVCFEGHGLNGRHAEALREGVRYCRKTFRPREGQLVLDQLITSQAARGVSLALAQTRARDALQRVGGVRYAARRPSDLDNAEAARVAIARALTHKPKLLVIDEPVLGVDLGARDQILSLLRSLADEGTAVLMSAGESSGLYSADRALALGEGELHGDLSALDLAPVVPLRHAAGGSVGA